MRRYKGEGQGGDPDPLNTEAVSTSSAHDATKLSTARQGDESNPFGGSSAARVIERYDYTDEDCEPLFQVRRWEPKRFTQHGWTGTRFGRKLNRARPVVYRLPQVIKAVSEEREAWIVEGERDVHSLEAVGEVATCNPMGAGNWRAEFTEWFRDASVTIVSDWDQVGQAHALAVYEQLNDVAASVEVVRAKTGKDVTDHLGAGHSLVDLVPVPLRELRALVKPKQHQTRHQAKTDAVVPDVLYAIVGRLAARGPIIVPSDPLGDWTVCCPVHDDQKPSATLRIGTDRPIVFHCHASCSQEDFFAWAKSAGIPNSDLMESKGAQSVTTLRAYTASEMAGLTLEPPKWCIESVLVQDTFGPLAGDKKTLKTYLMLLMSVAIAKGGSFLGRFKVPEAGPVLTFSGEGGRDPHVRRLRRVCDAMNVRLEDIPLINIYETAPLGSDLFVRTLELNLAEHEPKHTNLDPLYAFHPRDVTTSNLYERGPMFTRLAAPIIEAGSTLLYADHYNKNGSGDGLSRISMAGASESADSWMLVTHRKPPQVEEGRFWLKVEIGSRQWGGHTFGVDLSLGKLDPTTMEYDGRITFQVVESANLEGEEREASIDAFHKLCDKIEGVVLNNQFVLSKSQIRDVVKGNTKQFGDAWDRLVADGALRPDRRPMPDKNGVKRSSEVWGTP